MHGLATSPRSFWIKGSSKQLWHDPHDYAGKFKFAELDMNKTLKENGVPDEKSELEDYHVPTDFYIPVLHVYWNDDLTVA